MPISPIRAFPISPSVADNAENAQTIAVQSWVDAGDGNGPQLVTLRLDCVAVYQVDANGNVQDDEEVLAGAAWKKQLLDEVRAIRIGMEILTENRRFMPTTETSLIEQSQSAAGDADTVNPGREASENFSTNAVG